MGGSVGVKDGGGIMRVFVLSLFSFAVDMSGALSGLVGFLLAFGSSSAVCSSCTCPW